MGDVGECTHGGVTTWWGNLTCSASFTARTDAPHGRTCGEAKRTRKRARLGYHSQASDLSSYCRPLEVCPCASRSRAGWTARRPRSPSTATASAATRRAAMGGSTGQGCKLASATRRAARAACTSSTDKAALPRTVERDFCGRPGYGGSSGHIFWIVSVTVKSAFRGAKGGDPKEGTLKRYAGCVALGAWRMLAGTRASRTRGHTGRQP